jgi:hypothetical protein
MSEGSTRDSQTDPMHQPDQPDQPDQEFAKIRMLLHVCRIDGDKPFDIDEFG